MNTTVVLEEDPETGDLIMPIPVELLNQMGWDIGCILEWEDMGNGSFSLKKVEDDLQIEEDDDAEEIKGV